MKNAIVLFIVAVFVTASCVPEKREFTGARFIDFTINDYYPYVAKTHLSDTAHPLQVDIIELCRQFNNLTGEIVIAGGGWNKHGEFADGKQTGVGYEIIKRNKLLSKVAEFKRGMVLKYGKEEGIQDILEELDADLYLLTNYWTDERLKQYSIIKIATDLALVENKLILTEIKLYERNRCKNKGA